MTSAENVSWAEVCSLVRENANSSTAHTQKLTKIETQAKPAAAGAIRPENTETPKTAGTPIADSKAESPRLLDQVRRTMRVAHYAIRTEEAYVDWIRRFILFHHKRHPREMGAPEITSFLTHLAVEGKVAPSTQNQAISGLNYLYQQVLKIELPMIDAVRATTPTRLPVVLSVAEVRCLFDVTPPGIYRLMLELIYGSGLRLLECCR